MALEIIHAERSYIVVDNERGRWSSEWTYHSYLNARKFALAWKAAATCWRRRWYHIDRDYWALREIGERRQEVCQ